MCVFWTHSLVLDSITVPVRGETNCHSLMGCNTQIPLDSCLGATQADCQLWPRPGPTRLKPRCHLLYPVSNTGGTSNPRHWIPSPSCSFRGLVHHSNTVWRFYSGKRNVVVHGLLLLVTVFVTRSFSAQNHHFIQYFINFCFSFLTHKGAPSLSPRTHLKWWRDPCFPITQ